MEKQQMPQQGVDLMRSFAPVHKVEFFNKNYGRCHFDVAQAWRIVDAWTPEMRHSRFTVRELSDHQLDVIAVDTEKAMDADLSIPVLWVTVTEARQSNGELYQWTEMIDGYHRAYKSSVLKLGLALPSFVLSEQESAVCRVAEPAKKRLLNHR